MIAVYTRSQANFVILAGNQARPMGGLTQNGKRRELKPHPISSYRTVEEDFWASILHAMGMEAAYQVLGKYGLARLEGYSKGTILPTELETRPIEQLALDESYDKWTFRRQHLKNTNGPI